MKRSILMVTAIVFMSTLVIAQPPRHKKDGEGPENRKQRIEKMAQDLDLNDTQKKQIQEIHFKSKKSALPVKNELGEKEARLNTLSTVEKVDMGAIKSIAKEIGGLRNDLFLTRLETDQEIRSVLNEQQKLKFDMQNKHRKDKKRHN